MNPLRSFIPSLLGFGSACFMLGLITSKIVSQEDYGAEPMEISDENRGKVSARYKMRPITVKLRILSEEDFIRERPKSNVDGFAYIRHRPCEIVLPARWEIYFTPSKGYADFVQAYPGMVLAHELLHCMADHWHN